MLRVSRLRHIWDIHTYPVVIHNIISTFANHDCLVRITSVRETAILGIYGTFHLAVKMTTAQTVEASVTNNSFSKDYSHPDDHARQTTDTQVQKVYHGLKWATNQMSFVEDVIKQK